LRGRESIYGTDVDLRTTFKCTPGLTISRSSLLVLSTFERTEHEQDLSGDSGQASYIAISYNAALEPEPLGSERFNQAANEIHIL
jgi:hypothetical protein